MHRSLSSSSIDIPDFGSLSSSNVSPRPAIHSPRSLRANAATGAISSNIAPHREVEVVGMISQSTQTDPEASPPIKIAYDVEVLLHEITALRQTVQDLAQAYAGAVLASHSGDYSGSVADVDRILARYFPPATERVVPAARAHQAHILNDEGDAIRELQTLKAQYRALRASSPPLSRNRSDSFDSLHWFAPSNSEPRHRHRPRNQTATRSQPPDPIIVRTGPSLPRVKPNTEVLPVSPVREAMTMDRSYLRAVLYPELASQTAPVRPSSARSSGSRSSSRSSEKRAARPHPVVGYDFDARALLRAMAPTV